MSRSGDEMVLELASILNLMNKNASKKDEQEDKKEEKEDEKKKDEEKKESEDKKEDKEKEDKKKKSEALMGVVSSLVKLATELDESGATDASELVDEALRVIVHNIKQ